MARITVVGKNLTEQQASFIILLSQLRHEVTFLTSRNAGFDLPISQPIWSYFKKWNSWEAIKIFPRLLINPPEVLHFVFSDLSLEQITAAHHTLSALTFANPKTAVVVSFFGPIARTPDRAFTPLLKLANAVTTSTREDLMRLKRLKLLIKSSTTTEVIPPFFVHTPLQISGKTGVSETSPNPDLEKLLLKLKDYVVIPSAESFSENRFLQLRKHYKLIFLCPRPNNFSADGAHFLPVKQSLADLQLVLRKSRALILAENDLSLPELILYQNMSRANQTPLVVTKHQTELLPGLASQDRSGWILDGSPGSLEQLLFANPGLALHQKNFATTELSMLDSGLNDLNRIYQRAFDSKSAALR